MILSIAALFTITVSTHSYAFFFSKAELAFTGDIMMHYNVKKCAAAMNKKGPSGKSINNNGFDHLFAEIAPFFHTMDYVIGNMEFPVAPPFRQRGIIFNAPKEVIPGIKKAGVDLVSLANNHILDQYVKGALATIGFLNQYKLPFFGVGSTEMASRNGHIQKINGINVGFLAYAGLVNYPERNTGKSFYLNWLYNENHVIADIKRMKQQCEYLVLYTHTGVEYVVTPRESDRKLYRKYLDAGADIVVGHHPHVLQSMEQYKTRDGRSTAIFYSLGNFISDQQRNVPIRNTGKMLSIRDSVVVQLSLRKIFGSVSSTINIVPIHTIQEYTTSEGRRYKNIQTVIIHEKIEELEKQRSQYKQSDYRYKNLTDTINYYKNKQQTVRLTLFPGGKPADINYVVK